MPIDELEKEIFRGGAKFRYVEHHGICWKRVIAPIVAELLIILLDGWGGWIACSHNDIRVAPAGMLNSIYRNGLRLIRDTVMVIHVVADHLCHGVVRYPVRAVP